MEQSTVLLNLVPHLLPIIGGYCYTTASSLKSNVNYQVLRKIRDNFRRKKIYVKYRERESERAESKRAESKRVRALRERVRELREREKQS